MAISNVIFILFYHISRTCIYIMSHTDILTGLYSCFIEFYCVYTVMSDRRFNGSESIHIDIMP